MDAFWIAYGVEWMNLVVRWLHVITGIAWIGASFYFVWLDNTIRPPAAGSALAEQGVSGELWAVHGGGFYNPQKYLIAPKTLPQHLHWFKWEAYSTWLSGFALLTIVYYFNAQAMLVDRSVADMSSLQAIGIGLGSLVAAVVSFVAVKWLLFYVRSHTFSLFGWYRIAFGAFILVLIFR